MTGRQTRSLFVMLILAKSRRIVVVSVYAELSLRVVSVMANGQLM
jgi:hypothetical protein